MRCLLLVFPLVLTGCVTPVAFTEEEVCSTKNMVLQSVEFSTNTGMAFGTTGKTGIVGTGYGESAGATCARPQSEDERCEVNKNVASTSVKKEYNSRSFLLRNTTLGVGYALYILPGAILYLALDAERKSALRAASKAKDEVSCKAVAH